MSSREERILKAKEMALDVTRFKAGPEGSRSITDDLLRSLARIVADALDCCQKREAFHSFELKYPASGPVAHESRLGFVVHAFIVLMREMEGRIIGGEEEPAVSEVISPNNIESCSMEAEVKEEACMGVSADGEVKEEEREVKEEGEDEFDENRVKIEEEVDDLPGPSTDAVLDGGADAAAAAAAAAAPAAIPASWQAAIASPKGRWQCPVCMRTFLSESHFNNHLKTSHPEEYRAMSFACNRCIYRSLSQKATELHISKFCAFRKRRPLVGGGAPAIRRSGIARGHRTTGLHAGSSLDSQSDKETTANREDHESHVAQCSVCQMRLALDRYDLHFEVCHEKLWFGSTNKCSFAGCDFRSMVHKTRLAHMATHNPFDRRRFYNNRYLNCPFCQAIGLTIGDFTDHIELWHLSVVSSKKKIHACASCGFAAARFYEIVDHWKESVGKCAPTHAFNADAP